MPTTYQEHMKQRRLDMMRLECVGRDVAWAIKALERSLVEHGHKETHDRMLADNRQSHEKWLQSRRVNPLEHPNTMGLHDPDPRCPLRDPTRRFESTVRHTVGRWEEALRELREYMDIANSVHALVLSDDYRKSRPR